MTATFDFTAADSYIVNCSTLLTELPVMERAQAAKDAGFDRVEFWWPFDGNPTPSQAEVDEFIASLETGGIFLLKGAVKDVADALHCSQASVYRYLSQIKKEDA